VSRYVLSPAARADLEQIWNYSSERWDDDQAEDYLREVQRAIEGVVSNPTIGRACNDVRLGYRKHAVGSHTLYYRIGSDDVIDVVRVLDERMDADRHLD
jgi:toxin ParE1/3/4